MTKNILVGALCACTLLLFLPTMASASWFHHRHHCCGCNTCGCNKCESKCGCNTCGSDTGKCGVGETVKHTAYNDDYDNPTAVAAYTETRGMDYTPGSLPTTAMVDRARIDEYNNIFGRPSMNGRVASYTATWQPWSEGGTWVTVNGQRKWATQADFNWDNNRWSWSADPNAQVMFEDPRFNMMSRDWTMSWQPWNGGGTWVTVNGNRVWATPEDFTWQDNRWTWNKDNSASVTFEDPHYDVMMQDWGVSGALGHDRFDAPVSHDKLDLDNKLKPDTDKLKPNL